MPYRVVHEPEAKEVEEDDPSFAVGMCIGKNLRLRNMADHGQQVVTYKLRFWPADFVTPDKRY